MFKLIKNLLETLKFWINVLMKFLDPNNQNKKKTETRIII